LPPFCMRSNPGSSPAQAEGRIFSIMNINHAAKAGVTVREYKVMEQRDTEIEKGFDRITQVRRSEHCFGVPSRVAGIASFLHICNFQGSNVAGSTGFGFS